MDQLDPNIILTTEVEAGNYFGHPLFINKSAKTEYFEHLTCWSVAAEPAGRIEYRYFADGETAWISGDGNRTDPPPSPLRERMEIEMVKLRLTHAGGRP